MIFSSNLGIFGLIGTPKGLSTTKMQRPKSTASRYCPLQASPQGFKMRLLGEGFHTLINGGLFSSPTHVGHHNPPPFGAQRHRWHSFLPPIDVGPPSNPPPFEAQCPYWHTASCLPPSGNSEKAGTSSGVWL